jgi:hypothetical protein
MHGDKNSYKVLVGRSEGKRSLAGPGVDGTSVLKWIFKKSDGEA